MIGFYCSSTSWGGLEMNFVRYATWLKERGHKVIVFCVKGSPIDENASSSDHIIVHVKKNKKYYDISNTYRVYKLFKKYQIDIVWLRDTRDMSTIGLAKTFSRNNFKIVYQQAMQLGVKKKDLLHTIRFQKIDAWISLLPYLAEQVKSHTNLNPEKIHIVPLAAKIESPNQVISKEAARIKFGLPEEPFIMGVLGRIGPKKGHLFIVEQLKELREKGLNVEVLFVGEPTKNEGNEFINQLKETIKELDLTPFVHFHPFLKEVDYFYKAVDLFIMASKGETFGNVTIESMISGVPVLGTNSAGTPELLEHGKLGYLYEVNNGLDFCEKATWIIKNPKEVAMKVQNAQEVATQTYSKEHVCEQLEEVLKTIR